MHDHSMEEILQAYRAAVGEPFLKSGEWHGPCPNCGGEDRWWVTKAGVIGCRQCSDFAAIMQALGLSKASGGTPATYPESPPGDAMPMPEAPEVYGCTLAQYAEKTGLPEEWLMGEQAMVRETTYYLKSEGGKVPAVAFPYLDMGEEVVSTHIRIQVEGKDKYRYGADSSAALYLHPDWMDYAKARRKRIFCVEGQSCCQTLWYNELPAIGVPGASSCKVIEARHVEGIEQVYVVQEQDEAGSQFPGNVQARLREVGSSAVVLVVKLPAKDTNALWTDDPKKFRARFHQAYLRARGLRKSQIAANRFVTAREISRTNYPPVQWVVPGILPEGLGLLFAPPKAGKSFCALSLAVGASKGRRVFGEWPTLHCEVLYIDLEQPIGAKTKARLRSTRGDEDREMLTFIDEWPRVGEGCCEEMDIYLSEHPACKLVVVDVWEKIKGDISGNAYSAEYKQLAAIKAVADHRHAAIVLVHHDKKNAHATNATDAASGTKAVTGAPDVIWWLKRELGQSEGTFSVTGRDVEDWTGKAFFTSGGWVFERPQQETNDAGRWN